VPVALTASDEPIEAAWRAQMGVVSGSNERALRVGTTSEAGDEQNKEERPIV
jgi:hypothetical protein